MKKQFYYFTVILSWMTVISLSSCTKDDSSATDSVSNLPDQAGNIIITNNSGTELVIYDGSNKALKKIPNSLTDFIINIPNPNQVALDLKIYRYSDVSDDLNNPDESKIYKRWYIALSNQTDVSKRMTWFITSDGSKTISGSMVFSYVGGTDNQVEVYLNNHNGAKILTLAPGQQYQKTVGIDYGNYTICYRYFFSDPNTSTGPTYLGWLDKELVNAQEVDIYAIINEARKEVFKQIPHYNNGNAVGGDEYGKIQIKNHTAVPVQIWAGDQLIENVMYTTQAVQNYSTIAANSEITYTVPVKSYTFLAKNLVTAATVKQTDLIIIKDQTLTWDIEQKK